MKGQTEKPYRCMAFKGNEVLKDIFARNGCDIDSKKHEIGIVDIASLRNFNAKRTAK